MEHTRVVIVGAGPVGLEVAAALKAEGVDYVQVEAGQVGATIQWWPRATRWFSGNDRIAIAGVPLITPDQEKATREQYLAYLRTVVGSLGLEVRPFEPVTDIDRDDDGFVVTTAPSTGERQVRCEAVVLATGGTDRPRKLGIPGEELPHVEHVLPEPHQYFGRRVLVVGGKNSAVEAALRCHHVGADVALSYRGEALPEKSIKYWMMPEMKGLLAKDDGGIAGYFRTEPVKIEPGRVTLRRNLDGQEPETFEVEADHVLLCVGYEQDNRLFRLAGVELEGEQQRPVFDDATMQTNVPGLYVAGTAIGGTQSSYKVFLENCHVHADRIAAHLAGRTADAPDPVIAQPES